MAIVDICQKNNMSAHLPYQWQSIFKSENFETLISTKFRSCVLAAYSGHSFGRRLASLLDPSQIFHVKPIQTWPYDEDVYIVVVVALVSTNFGFFESCNRLSAYIDRSW